jgi:hypothetical protein
MHLSFERGRDIQVNSEGLGKLEWFGFFKMEDTRSPGPIFQARQDGNIFGKILTLFTTVAQDNLLNAQRKANANQNSLEEIKTLL